MLKKNTLNDTVLANRVQSQDEEAFEILYTQYHQGIFRHLCAIVRSEAAAQDLLQEVFLRLWTRADQFSGQGNFRSWLFRISTNLALNHLRALRRHPAEILPTNEETAWDDWSEEETTAPGWLVDTTTLDPHQLLELSEYNASVHQAIDRLPQEKREVIQLIHEMELSIRDTASRLGIPEGTVKSRLHYAQKLFNQVWRGLDNREDTE
jgi:RNA polymerase sigma-70 factor, ECF subfamily